MKEVFGSGATKWFGVNPIVIVIGIAILLLMIVTLPLFTVTKAIEVKEVILTSVAKEVPETVNTVETKKVYVGWMKEQSTSYSYSGPMVVYTPGRYYSDQQYDTNYFAARGTGGSGNIGGGGGSYYSFYNPYYSSNQGRQYTVDATDEITEYQIADDGNGTWNLTLTDVNGKQQVYRNIGEYDLTKTGETKVPTTITKMKIVQEQVPQQVTKQQIINLRVNLIQLLFRLY